MQVAVTAEETAPKAQAKPQLANALTLSRLALAAAQWLVPRRPRPIFGIMLAAGVTDLLDGYVARRARIRHGMAPRADHGAGVWLDPICDKAFVLSTLGIVERVRRPPKHVLGLIAAREMALVLVATAWVVSPRLRRRPLDFHAAPIGKLATTSQFLALTTLLFELPGARLFAAIAGATGVAAAGHYVRRTFLR